MARVVLYMLQATQERVVRDEPSIIEGFFNVCRIQQNGDIIDMIGICENCGAKLDTLNIDFLCLQCEHHILNEKQW